MGADPLIGHPPGSETLHASSVVVDDRALLILGAAGSGKSALALQLMALGADLLADDRTIITREGKDLLASCPESISGMIEARGVGILNARPAAAGRVGAVVDMNRIESDRLPPPKNVTLLGVTLPCLHKVEASYFPAAIVQYLRCGIRETL